MAAARVGPQTSRMILVDLPPLQQQAASAVPDHDRECAVQVTALVRLELLLRADFVIVGIDEDDVFVGHQVISSLHRSPGVISIA